MLKILSRAILKTLDNLSAAICRGIVNHKIYKKLPIVFEYPVFKTDIKKYNYNYISLGNTFAKNGSLRLIDEKKARKAARNAVEIACNPKQYQELVEKNFAIAKKHHNVALLEKNLQKWLG